MKKNWILIIFWALMAVFVYILCQFFLPPVRDFVKGSELFLVPLAVFCLLGLALTILVFKAKESGRKNLFFLLTGFSSFGFFIFVFLHNAFYALAEISKNIVALNYLLEALEVIFFITAVIICPIVFLIGSIGAIVLFVKER